MKSKKIGGAIISQDSNIQVTSCEFDNNHASSGGALALLCSKSMKYINNNLDIECHLKITSSNFTNNYA